MIFVTVGTQLPFDRLLQAVNDWAGQNPAETVIAQTGQSRADFPFMTCHAMLDQTQFRATLDAADVVIAHAGMGSILMAAEAGKPIIIMPRRAALGEHRNDHQCDTAAKMAALSNVTLAETPEALADALSALHAAGANAAPALPPMAQPQLIAALHDFIWTGERKPAARLRPALQWSAS